MRRREKCTKARGGLRQALFCEKSASVAVWSDARFGWPRFDVSRSRVCCCWPPANIPSTQTGLDQGDLGVGRSLKVGSLAK